MVLHSPQFRVLVFALAMALGVCIVRFNSSRDAKSTKLLYICWVLKWRSNNRQNNIKPIIQQQLGPEIFEITHPIVPERCVLVSSTTTKKTSLLFRHPSTRRYYEEILFLSIAIIAWNNSYKHFLYGNWIVLHPKPIIQPIIPRDITFVAQEQSTIIRSNACVTIFKRIITIIEVLIAIIVVPPLY